MNKSITGKETLSQADLASLCEETNRSVSYGLGAGSRKAFKDWLIRKASVGYQYSAQQMQAISKVVGRYADGFGIGIGLHAAAVAGVGGAIEYIVHDQELALFCAASADLVTDVGVGADVIGIKTLGCKSNQDYTGQFASFGISGSFEAFGIPAEVGATFNLGVRVQELFDKVLPFWRDNREEIKRALLRIDRADLDNDRQRFVRDVLLRFYQNVDVSISSDPGFERGVDAITQESMSQLNEYKRMLIDSRENFSFEKELKELETIVKHDLDSVALENALNLTRDVLTGCNSVTLYAGPGISLSPVAGSVSLSQYEVLGRVKLPTFADLRKYFFAINQFVRSNRGTSCEMNESQKHAYVQIIKLMQFLENARSLVPSLHTAHVCHKKLGDSAASIVEYFKKRKIIDIK